MHDWREIYRERLTTPEEAVRHIPDNSRILFAHAVAHSTPVSKALTDNYKQYRNLEICHWFTPEPCPYFEEEMEGHLHFNALFVGGPVRLGVKEFRADYTPMFFSDTPRQFTDGSFPLDVVVLTVSPPDKHGYVSLGTSVCATRPGARSAKMVIAEVNTFMPRTLGDSFMHVSEIDYLIETSRPLPEVQPAELNDIERTIGAHCASLVEDGATLQLGIGNLPDAMLLNLKGKKDLGIHSEMFSDGVVELVETGVVTGARKSIHKGKIIAGFLMGTRRLYDFVDDNPIVQLMEISYVNDPRVIAQNSKMTSINSCLQVDFCGQVNAESIGLQQFSGIGGQLDFVRGASMCPDGKAILAMPSTAAKGTISRIMPVLEPGTTVTTTRVDAHYIVTEYGIASLRGKSLRQRALALIDIAHPVFREGLEREFMDRYKRKSL